LELSNVTCAFGNNILLADAITVDENLSITTSPLSVSLGSSGSKGIDQGVYDLGLLPLFQASIPSLTISFEDEFIRAESIELQRKEANALLLHVRSFTFSRGSGHSLSLAFQQKQGVSQELPLFDETIRVIDGRQFIAAKRQEDYYQMRTLLKVGASHYLHVTAAQLDLDISPNLFPSSSPANESRLASLLLSASIRKLSVQCEGFEAFLENLDLLCTREFFDLRLASIYAKYREARMCRIITPSLDPLWRCLIVTGVRTEAWTVAVRGEGLLFEVPLNFPSSDGAHQMERPLLFVELISCSLRPLLTEEECPGHCFYIREAQLFPNECLISQHASLLASGSMVERLHPMEQTALYQCGLSYWRVPS